MVAVFVFPITVELLPKPVVPSPITIWLIWLSANALALCPMKIDELAAVNAVDPFAIYLPALCPKATLLLPVVFEFNA